MLSLDTAAQEFLDAGDYDAAEELLLLALTIQESISGKDSLAVSEPLFNLGLLYFAKNEYSKAEEYLLRCLSIERRELSPDSRTLAETINTLTAIHVEKYLSRCNPTAISA